MVAQPTDIYRTGNPLTDELVADAVALLQIGGAVDDAVDEGENGRLVGDGFRRLQLVDHGTEPMGLVRFSLYRNQFRITYGPLILIIVITCVVVVAAES